MPILVDDVAKAREVLLEEARAAGIKILPVESFNETLDLHVKVESTREFVAHARDLDARVIFVFDTGMTPEEAEASVKRYEEVDAAVPGVFEADPLGRSLRRFVEVMKQGGAPDFRAAFNHAGILLKLRVVDKESWPALEALETAGEPSASGDSDEEEDELTGVTGGEIAAEIVDHLKEAGLSKAELRRDAAVLVRRAASELYPGPDELTAASRAEVVEGIAIAETKLRRGAL